MNSYIAECLEKFQDLPQPLKEAVGGFETCLKIKEIEDRHQGIVLGFAVILLAIGEIEADKFPEYLQARFDLKDEEAKIIAQEVIEEVITPAFKAIGIVDNEEFQGDVVDIFKKDIIKTLDLDNDSLKIVNQGIFKFVADNPEMEDRLADYLRNNQELLSRDKVEHDGRMMPGTIENWLGDYISHYGSDNFDEISIIQYLASSPNANKLEAPIKNKLRRVLRLYYNFVFFPESMEGVPVENWEVFPLHLLKSSAVDLEDNENSQAQQLRDALQRYVKGSLEYKAISEEIERLEKKGGQS